MVTGSFLAAAQARTPFWADGAVEFARHWVLPHFRAPQRCRRLLGTAPAGPASVLVVGDSTQLDLDTLAPGFFAGAPRVEALASISGHGLVARLVTELALHDLVLCRTWRVFARDPAGAFLPVPDLPEMRLSVGPRERMLAVANATMRTDIRGSEALGFTISHSTDEASFERFYRDFHLPFIQARHDTGAVVHMAQTLRRRLRRGGITWVSLGDERVHGSAFEIAGGVLRELVLGTAAGRSDAVVRAAARVARVEHMRLAHAAGLRWLSLGGSAPWLSNGVMAHKRAWGGELVDRPANHRVLLVGWQRWSPAVARFLAAFPLLVRRPWGFGAVAAAEGDAAVDRHAALSRWRRQSPHGLRRLVVVGRSGTTTTLWRQDGERHDVAQQPLSSAALLRILDAEPSG